MPAVNNLVRDFVLQDISAAMDSFEKTRAVEHRGLKGKAREIFVKKLFQSLLTNDFKFGSGVITDRHGNQAKETDVILYCPEVLPARDAHEAVGYFPIESCIYAIEVKSVVTAKEIEDAIKKGQALDTLECLFFTNYGPLSTRPITVLFGFSSDLKSGPEEEFKRFKSLINAAGHGRFGAPPIRVLCVVGKGYWYYGMANNAPTLRWNRTAASGQYQYSEILSLIAGILNTVRTEKLRRYGLCFGHYLLDDAPILDAGNCLAP
jgi:hypothetical protein